MAWIQDLRYAVRLMRRSPGPAIFAILTLALGIGANTAMFSAVYAVLRSPAMRSIHDPQSMVMLWGRNPAMMEVFAQRMPVSPNNYRELQRQNRSFEDMTAFSALTCILNSKSQTAGSRPKRMDGIQIQSNFFSLMGIRPALGRMFTAEESHTAADRIALLSADLYKSLFGSDSDLAGKSVRVDGIERTIIGVLPESYQMPSMWAGSMANRPQIWIPLDLDSKKTIEDIWLPSCFVYARLRPDVTLAQARAEMDVMAARLRQEYPGFNNGLWGLTCFPIAEEDAGPEMRRNMLVLQFAVGFVLLIACANVGHLLLARAMSRDREIAIQLALGARRSRIVRLMFMESLLLSILAGAAGLFIAFWSLCGISAIAPEDWIHLGELSLEPPVLVYAFIISAMTAFLSGILPAWHAAKQNINAALAKSSRWASRDSQWVRGGMVIGEVALSLILLIGSGLMIGSLRMLMNVDLGFKPDHLLTVRFSVVNVDGKQAEAQQVKSFCDRLLDRVQALPGVKHASLSSGLPMRSVTQGNYDVEGGPRRENDAVATITQATGSFFSTIGVQIKRGRGFTRAETEIKKPAVIVVSESFARLNWPGQEPLGKIVLFENKSSRLTVIGIVADTHPMGPEGGVIPEMYIPCHEFPSVNLALRTEGDPVAMVPAIEKAVWNLNPAQPLDSVRVMDRDLFKWPASAEKRFFMVILVSFAALALTLASLGLYGVLTYVVRLRTRELGVRMALGASAREIIQLVIGQGLKLTLLGVAIGLAGAFLLTRLMQSLIFGVSAKDPLIFGCAAGTIAIVSLLAGYLPARRAAKIDPIESLRAE